MENAPVHYMIQNEVVHLREVSPRMFRGTDRQSAVN